MCTNTVTAEIPGPIAESRSAGLESGATRGAAVKDKLTELMK